MTALYNQESFLPSTTSSNSVAQTADVWLKIDQLHLNYLKAEESTSKMSIKKKLEGGLEQK